MKHATPISYCKKESDAYGHNVALDKGCCEITCEFSFINYLIFYKSNKGNVVVYHYNIPDINLITSSNLL